MNERIKKLKDLARDYYLSQEDLDCSSHRELHDMIEQKFAELIVLECANIALIEEHDPSDCILNHFGLKR